MRDPFVFEVDLLPGLRSDRRGGVTPRVMPEAIQYRPHLNCAAMADLLGIEDDCTGDGDSPQDQTYVLRGGSLLTLNPGDVVLINPGFTISRNGSDTIVVLDSATATAVRQA